MLKRILRIGSRVGAIVLVVLVIGFADFYRWRSHIIEGIETDPRRRIVTTALGNVEYAIVGDGVPMLMFHGSLGGYDSALNLGGEIPGTMKIGVSRPGYLGTPLSSGATHQEQADLFAALLDELGIEKVIVYSASAGGPFGMQFALRHSDRTAGLILASTGWKREPVNDVPQLNEAMLLLGDTYMWVSARLFPSLLANGLTDNFDPSDPAQLEQVRSVATTLVPMDARWQGNLNDGTQLTNTEIENWALGENSVPVLVLIGDADPMVSYQSALRMAEAIPYSQLLTIEGGGHGVFTTEQRRQVASAIQAFIQSVAKGF